MEKIKVRLQGNELKLFTIFSNILLLIAAFASDSPENIILGMKKIIVSHNALITDYFEMAGAGAAFFNAALVLGICVGLVLVQKIPFTGPTMAALFINAGYGLWGKNPVNILPILLGTYLYAKIHHAHLGRYIYTALFGTCLSPFVTELVYMLPYSYVVNVCIAVLVGLLIGFLLPPLSVHTASMHMGYNLFNVGFSAGVVAFVLMCVMRSLGLESETFMIWRTGRPVGIGVCLYLYFMFTILLGLWLSRGKLDGLRHIFKHPGRAVADFVLRDGAGATLMNMGIIGVIGTTYIILIGGDFSGPVLGAMWTAFGFAAFGAHVKNYLPVLLGVYLFTFISKYDANVAGIQLAALFGVGIAPIAGQFGWFAGILAGMLHSVIVMCTSGMYGGLNLYNNGFSAGWVAIIMVPTLESFMKHYESRKHGKKEENREAKKDGSQ